DVSFSQPIRDNVLESISQIDGQIVVKLRGDDLVTLTQLANKVVGLARRRGAGRRGLATAQTASGD
ncbi:MAG: hypothetical protein CFE34_09920, partial [Rhodobacteraceae bacterium PARR1]